MNPILRPVQYSDNNLPMDERQRVRGNPFVMDTRVSAENERRIGELEDII